MLGTTCYFDSSATATESSYCGPSTHQPGGATQRSTSRLAGVAEMTKLPERCSACAGQLVWIEYGSEKG